MKRCLLLVGIFALAFTLAGGAMAAELAWKGTLNVRVGTFPENGLSGTGVATVNNSSGGSHLTTLRIGGGITGTVTGAVTDPEVTGVGLLSVKLSQVNLGTGTFAPFSNGGGPLSQNTMPIMGFARLCLFFSGCNSAFLPLPLSSNTGMTGAGVGGFQTIGGFGTIRVSLLQNPWTIGTQMVTNIGTDNGGVTTRTLSGFVHGPASATSSSAALTSAVVQLVTQSRTVTAGLPTGGAPNSISDVRTRFTFHVIPEPGILLLLGTGVAGLVALGRSRMRR